MRATLCIIVFLLTSLLARARSVDTLLQSLRSAQSDSALLVAYRGIYDHYQHSNTDSGIYYLQQGYKEFIAKNYKPGICEMLSYLAANYSLQGNMDLARIKQKEALAIAVAIDYKNGIGMCNNGLGIIEGRSGNYAMATRYFLDALHAYDAIKSNSGLVNTYIKLGAVNELTGSPDKALDYYRKALSLSPPEAANTVYLYNNMGIVYMRAGKYAEAIPYFERSLEAGKKGGYDNVTVLPLTNLGGIYVNYGDTARALTYYYQALQIAEKAKLFEDHTRLILNIAILVAVSDKPRALTLLQQALAATKQMGQKVLQAEVLEELITIHREDGNYKEAFDLLEQKKIVLDSVFNIEKAKEIANLQSIAELEQSNQRIARMEVDEKRKAWQMNAILAALCGLLFICISQFYSYRRKQRLIKALSLREQELAKSNATKDRLLSIIGHDLRGPVANMPVLLDLYLDNNTSPDEEEYIISSLRSNASASLETLDNLLGWGRHQIKGASVAPRLFMANHNLQNKLRLLQAAADLKHITLHSSVTDEVMVYADPEHFKFIVRNLLSNAIKYSNEGGRVEISADSQPQPGFVVFAVRDYGTGMDAQQQVHIFESLSVSTAGTANEKGTGIGLLLCKEFLQENGGRIWVESEKGKGATFYFSLPSQA